MAGRDVKVRARLSDSQKALFTKGTPFMNAGNRLQAPFQEMAIGEKISYGKHSKKFGKSTVFTDRRNMLLPDTYTGYGSKKVGNTRQTRGSWRATLKIDVIVFKSPKEFLLHLHMVKHMFPIAQEHWRNLLAHRALKVFQESFELKKFNSDGEKSWRHITKWTKQKRKWHGYWPNTNRLLQETNKLYKSLHIEKNKVVADAPYAGYHNDPENGMTYGNGFGGKYSPPKLIKRRQFMGHSTKMEEFALTYIDRYLFDNIFRRPA